MYFGGSLFSSGGSASTGVGGRERRTEGERGEGEGRERGGRERKIKYNTFEHTRNTKWFL